MVISSQDKVFIKGTCSCLARVVGDDAVAITQADTNTVTYSVFSLDSAGDRSVVSGHDGAALSDSDVVFDTLQTDDRWEEDDTGYNFRHTINISENAAFASRGEYLIEYLITPVSGQRIVVRFRINAV